MAINERLREWAKKHDMWPAELDQCAVNDCTAEGTEEMILPYDMELTEQTTGLEVVVTGSFRVHVCIDCYLAVLGGAVLNFE